MDQTGVFGSLKQDMYYLGQLREANAEDVRKTLNKLTQQGIDKSRQQSKVLVSHAMNVSQASASQPRTVQQHILASQQRGS